MSSLLNDIAIVSQRRFRSIRIKPQHLSEFAFTAGLRTLLTMKHTLREQKTWAIRLDSNHKVRGRYGFFDLGRNSVAGEEFDNVSEFTYC